MKSGAEPRASRFVREERCLIELTTDPSKLLRKEISFI